MADLLLQKDIEDGKKINEIFSNISEESKTMAIVYMSALLDKEMAISQKDIKRSDKKGK